MTHRASRLAVVLRSLESPVRIDEHLGTLSSRFGVDFTEITFVDDKVDHLDDVAHLGVRCVLAAWGYNGLREQRIARESGHLVCELADAERLLFAETGPG